LCPRGELLLLLLGEELDDEEEREGLIEGELLRVGVEGRYVLLCPERFMLGLLLLRGE